MYGLYKFGGTSVNPFMFNTKFEISIVCLLLYVLCTSVQQRIGLDIVSISGTYKLHDEVFIRDYFSSQQVVRDDDASIANTLL